MKANQKIREQISVARLKNWEVADRVGISDSRFSVWLRKPLDVEKERKVLSAIEELKKEV